MQPIDWVTGRIMDWATDSQCTGPGALESVCEVVIEQDFVRGGFRVEREEAIEFEFDGLRLENALVPGSAGGQQGGARS
jgi:hypothetical protein